MSGFRLTVFKLGPGNDQTFRRQLSTKGGKRPNPVAPVEARYSLFPARDDEVVERAAVQKAIPVVGSASGSWTARENSPATDAASRGASRLSSFSKSFDPKT